MSGAGMSEHYVATTRRPAVPLGSCTGWHGRLNMCQLLPRLPLVSTGGACKGRPGS